MTQVITIMLTILVIGINLFFATVYVESLPQKWYIATNLSVSYDINLFHTLFDVMFSLQLPIILAISRRYVYLPIVLVVLLYLLFLAYLSTFLAVVLGFSRMAALTGSPFLAEKLAQESIVGGGNLNGDVNAVDPDVARE